MRQIVAVILIASAGILPLSGCRESEASQIRRARVIGNENIELKQQLADKDLQIEALKKQIEDLEAQSVKDHEEFGSTTLRTLQMVADGEKQNQELTLEIEKLKEELKALKAR